MKRSHINLKLPGRITYRDTYYLTNTSQLTGRQSLMPFSDNLPCEQQVLIELAKILVIFGDFYAMF
jgi:hypothetical protein